MIYKDYIASRHRIWGGPENHFLHIPQTWQLADMHIVINELLFGSDLYLMKIQRVVGKFQRRYILNYINRNKVSWVIIFVSEKNKIKCMY